MQRVLVIGSCGAGKSTLAKRLHKATGLKPIHLDRFYHKPNWGKPTDEEWLETVKVLISGEDWIIDGNFGGTMEFRMKHCDTVIWLDFPRILCTYRTLKRTITHWNKTRSDMAEGCNERFDWEFTKYVWNFARDKNLLLEARFRKLENVKMFRLRSGTEVEIFFKNLNKNQSNKAYVA